MSNVIYLLSNKYYLFPWIFSLRCTYSRPAWQLQEFFGLDALRCKLPDFKGKKNKQVHKKREAYIFPENVLDEKR